MKNRVAMFGALLAVTGIMTFAADIDGKWTAETQGRNGPQTQTLTLKSSGATLTGSLDGGRGATDITNGKVEGSNVSFDIVRQGRDGANNTTNYKGELSGDELKLTVTRQAPAGGGGGGGGGGGKGGPQELTFKRAK